MPDLDARRARLRAARLYLICDLRPGGRSLADVRLDMRFIDAP